MNPTPSDKPVVPTRGEMVRNDESEFDVNSSDIALCSFSYWMDGELGKLEEHFRDFVTARSQKHGLGR